MENPIDSSIKLYNTDYFNLKESIEDTSRLESIIIYIDWISYKDLWNTRRINTPINQWRDLSIWDHIIKVESTDKSWNKSENKIYLTVLAK